MTWGSDLVFLKLSFLIYKIGKRYGTSRGFPGGSVVKNPPANAGDVGSIHESGRSPREGNGNPPQYSCLANPMDTKAWQTTVYGVARVGHN